MDDLVHQLRCYFAERLFYAALSCMPKGSPEELAMAKAISDYIAVVKAAM